MLYAFAGFEIDVGRVELRSDGYDVHVEPQVFDVLVYLIANRDRLVTKQELLDEVWGGPFVGESALTSRIKTARQLIGDSGREQKFIRTVHGRGYQFVAEVSEHGPPRTGAEGLDALLGAPAPSGVVTFLFFGIDQSSQLWERHPESMASAVATHDDIIRTSVGTNHGVVFTAAGAGIAAAFDRPGDAIAAARDARSRLDAERWPAATPLRVRLGLHTGEAHARDGGYVGAAVNRAALVMAAAHGGQTLMTDATAAMIGSREGLKDLGICTIDASMPAMRVWQLDGPEFPLLRGTVAAPPPQLRTELIGRTEVLEHVVDLATRERIVSIVGPGGVGKTTLGLAAANALLASFGGGVLFVELASVGDADGIARAVAAKAGIETALSADVPALAAHLARRPVLLILDNCEHLLDACADFVDMVLDLGVTAHVVITSREPLGVEGERVVPLASLEEHAAQLFVIRAAAAAPDVELAVTDPRVVDVCERLDGLPLAVELAAAQLGHLTIDDLSARLHQRLDLSRGGRSRGRERHATLEQTIAWSYDLLDEPGRWLLRQFGVFPGTFDLEAAEAVGERDGGPPTMSLVSDLVAKSLVVRHAATGRLSLLETIRLFAHRRLTDASEDDEAHERLRSAVVTRARRTSRLDRWLSGKPASALRADLDNLRFAFDRSMSAGEYVDALEILISCSFLFRLTLNCEDGRQWAERLRQVQDTLDVRDRLWLTLIRLDIYQGAAEHELGRDASKEAVRLAERCNDDAARVIALHFNLLRYVVVAPEVAAELIESALEIARSLDDERLVRLLRGFEVMVALSAGDLERARALGDEVAGQDLGDGYEVWIGHWAAWTANLIGGQFERSRQWQERQRRYLMDIGIVEPWLFVWSDAFLLAAEGGDDREALRLARSRADSEGHDTASDTVLALAMIEHFAGRAAEAAELLGAIDGHPLNNLSHYVMLRTLHAGLGNELGQAVLATGLARGAVLTTDEILDVRGLSLGG